jgi:chromosomal replication initiation ATPase DnaA
VADNPWDLVLARIRPRLDGEDFRRWFSGTHYAADAGDQITVWVHSESIRRHITAHFQKQIDEALDAIGRGDADVRFVVTGIQEDEDETDS